MDDWTDIDRRRDTLLMEQCREQRLRTRQLVEVSRRLTASRQSPYAKPEKTAEPLPPPEE